MQNLFNLNEVNSCINTRDESNRVSGSALDSTLYIFIKTLKNAIIFSKYTGILVKKIIYCLLYQQGLPWEYVIDVS